MGLYYLVKDQGKSMKTAKALSVRIILSLLLFIALVLAFAFGLISPHPLMGWNAIQSIHNTPPDGNGIEKNSSRKNSDDDSKNGFKPY